MTEPRASVDPTARRARWEAATHWLLLALSIVFIACYSIAVLAPGAPSPVGQIVIVGLIVVWIAFTVDLVARLALTPAGQRGALLGRNLVDVISVVIPPLRGLRVVQLLTHIPYLRRRTGTAVRARVALLTIGYLVVLIYLIALAGLQAERGAPGASIQTFPDALWWAIVTVTTVGYGDLAPVTPGGRFAAVLLMVGGVALIGTASALVVSYVTERIRAGERILNDDGPRGR